MIKKRIQSAVRQLGYDIRQARPGDVYDSDGLLTNNNHAFSKSPDFQKAYWRGVNGTTGTTKDSYGEWRVHIALWAAQTALRKAGDFVECGTWLGFMSSAIMTFVDWNTVCADRRFILVDNFNGIIPSQLTAEELSLGRLETFAGRYTSTFERAKQNLSEFNNVEFVRGDVPDVLLSVKTDKIAFLHIDMNAALPEIAALTHFWDRLVPGGIVLLDDYAMYTFEPQQIAFDELGERLGFVVAALPTGQGLILK
jgi:hypothetical protein